MWSRTARKLNLDIEIVLRTHSEDESQLLRRDGIGSVFFGEEELANGLARHVLERFAPPPRAAAPPEVDPQRALPTGRYGRPCDVSATSNDAPERVTEHVHRIGTVLRRKNLHGAQTEAQTASVVRQSQLLG